MTTTNFPPVGAPVLWTTPDGKSKRAGTVEEITGTGMIVVRLNVVLSVVAHPSEVTEAFEVVSPST